MAPTFDNARANGPHLVEAIDRGWVGTVTGNCPWAPVSRLAGIGHDLAGTAADQSFGLSYNPASQIAQRTSSNDSYRSTSAYAVSRAYAVNGLNQYTQAGPATFLYDLNDNLISDGSTSFVYDAENRLVSASGARTAALSYDPLGRLWQVVGAQRTTRFTYDGDALIGEWDGVGTLRRRYVHGSDASADDPLLWYDWLWGYNRQPLFADHQGSIVAVADANGVAWAANGYDAWGIPNANNAGRFGYTGQVWIPELGLWHYKARVYSPTLGRFLQTDPVAYDDQVNLYAYVGNDPVNHTDPTGALSDYAERCNSGNSRYCGMQRTAEEREERHTFRNILAAGGAVIGGAAGGGIGGAGGAVACSPGGPAALACAGAGAVQGVAIGAVAGGAAGALIGNAIDQGIAVFRGDRAPRLNEGQDVTSRGSGRQVRQLNQTTDQVRANLRGRGFESRPTGDGRGEIFRRGNAEYVIRPSTSSPSGYKIDLRINGQIAREFITRP